MRDLVGETFGGTGLLSKTIHNYIEREQQVVLANKIKTSIETKTPLIAECPTGSGKSIGALVPAFEHIMRTDEPVVVATSSIVLSEQYIFKDIPMLEKMYDFKVNAILIKGRNNYLCPKKLNEARKGNVGFTNSEQLKTFEEVLKWAVSSEQGDKNELDFVPSNAVWSQFACLDSNECTGKQCSFYSICPYYRERQKMNSAKLVVTNYHYLFHAIYGEADNMLPPKVSLIIMDEAHEVNAIARDLQEQKYSMNSLRNQFDHFAKAMKKAEHSDVGETVHNLMLDMELDQINATLTDLFVGLGHEFKKIKNSQYKKEFWKIDDPERTQFQKYAAEHIEALKFGVTTAENYLRKFGFSFEELPAMEEIYGEDAVEWFVSVHKLMDTLEEKEMFLRYFFLFDEVPMDENIFWMQPYQESVSIHAKPTTGKGLIQPLFRDSTSYVPICMSATLAANQSFEHLKADFGIDSQEYKVNELIVSSPFELEENLLWYLPADTPQGTDADHIHFALAEMKKVIDLLNGKTLCLFTSKKNLLQAESYFMRALPTSIRLLSQDKMPKQKIINFMKGHDRTVILGTKSFFTGVDIQGAHLSAVLMDKFPFPMLGDPVNDYLMSQPRGFHKYSLPEAIISMKQGFGRLNRTATDKGIVAIYDGRLSTAKYKNKIFNSFDFKVRATRKWEDIVEYVENMKQEGILK